MRSASHPMRSASCWIAAALMISITTGAFQARAACDKEQLAAEAALLKHTQIMVTSLLCDSHSKQAYRKQGPYALYKTFTDRHRRALANWETQVMSKMGQTQFDFWRTELANEVSRTEVQRASAVGKEFYCEGAIVAIEEAMRLSGHDVLAFAMLGPGDMARCAIVEMSERPPADDAGPR